MWEEIICKSKSEQKNNRASSAQSGSGNWKLKNLNY